MGRILRVWLALVMALAAATSTAYAQMLPQGAFYYGATKAGGYDSGANWTFGSTAGTDQTHLFQSAGATVVKATTAANSNLSFELNRTVNTASRWQTYLPSGSTDWRLWNSSASDVITAATTGIVTFSAGIKLPTSGGTPSTLDYYGAATYQNGGTTLTFTQDDGSALSASPSTYKLAFRRLGNVVVVQMSFSSLTINTTGKQVKISGFSSSFQPTTAQFSMVPIMNGATNGISPVNILSTSAALVIGSSSQNGTFNSTNTLSTSGATVTFTYILD